MPTILVTGEGRTDEQTAGGKLCAVLAAKARKAGASTILISGALDGDLGELDGLFDAVFAAVQDVCFARRGDRARTKKSVHDCKKCGADPGHGPGSGGGEMKVRDQLEALRTIEPSDDGATMLLTLVLTAQSRSYDGPFAGCRVGP